ncbi:hypothetical protein [Streptomyces sp. NPDC056707]|uniref:hypothetical protein n=1 Tax=Streptomyces sp. NPDC056707 TaxID=3345919 RepID=UPI00368E04E8
MADEANLKQQAQNAIYTKIVEAADGIEPAHGPANAAAILKDLAEAYAWATYANNSH